MERPKPACLGVLMLDTRFPRVLGDIGNPSTFSCPVLHKTVDAAGVGEVVTADALPGPLVERFCAAARELEEQGATLIVASCGFLSTQQSRLNEVTAGPVVTSALWLLPHLRTVYGKRAVFGILTFDSRRLTARHVPDPGPHVIAGLEDGSELYPAISGNLSSLDEARARADALDAARKLTANQPRLSAIVLECTNLMPYRSAIAGETGLPVYDLRSAIELHMAR